jgi:hypothetical protein
VAGRRAADRQNNDPGGGGDHAAGQQRPAGAHGVGAETGFADDLHARGVGVKILTGRLSGAYSPTGEVEFFFR